MERLAEPERPALERAAWGEQQERQRWRFVTVLFQSFCPMPGVRAALRCSHVTDARSAAAPISSK